MEWLWRGTDDTQSSPYGNISGVALISTNRFSMFFFQCQSLEKMVGCTVFYICRSGEYDIDISVYEIAICYHMKFESLKDNHVTRGSCADVENEHSAQCHFG